MDMNQENSEEKKIEKQKDLENTFANEFHLINYSEAEDLIKEDVKGQDEAIERILTTTYRSYEEDDKQEPTVILLIGPTGVGKSYIIKKLLKILDVPYALENANDLTKAGYEGEDINDMFFNLVNSAKDYRALNKSIIFIDEIDKLVGYSDDDVGGASVYKALLASLDGRKINISPPKNMKNVRVRTRTLDTTNIIFIMAGAFNGLDRIREQRLLKKNSIGFSISKDEKTSDKKVLDRNYIKQDIIKFGILPEFVGRINNIVELKPHSVETLTSIVKDANSSKYKRYVNLLKEKHNVDIEVYDGFFEEIAKKANSMGTGAREIVTIVNSIFDKIFTEIFRKAINNSICVLAKGIVEDNTKYTWKEKDASK